MYYDYEARSASGGRARRNIDTQILALSLSLVNIDIEYTLESEPRSASGGRARRSGARRS